VRTAQVHTKPPAFGIRFDNLAGQASIIDGDTLEIHGTRIRLWGIDAPESNQLCRSDDSIQYRCGAKAANDLDAFLNKRPIDCSPISLDQYGRTVAACSVDGVDLADWLVRNGLALAWVTSAGYEIVARGVWIPAKENGRNMASLILGFDISDADYIGQYKISTTGLA
jgi:endonuclease YncB( thermonuclease family)